MALSNPLIREEYIEQEYFFRVWRERMRENVPSQEFLKTIQEEILSTCQLPVAIDILRTEVLHSGRMGAAMKRMSHYFTAFQTFVVDRAENDTSRFEQITALQILEREARYRAAGVSPAGLFMFQFECIARNRLGYHDGLEAIASDPVCDEAWQSWIRNLKLQLGVRDLAELVYRASENFRLRRASVADAESATHPARAAGLFGNQEGRIARANIGRDPAYFFAALQRQLSYPSVPLPKQPEPETLPPVLGGRLARIEQRLKLLEMEQKGGIDLSRYSGLHRSTEDPADTSS